MKRHVVALAIALCLPASSVTAQVAGTASGKGTMDRSVPGKTAGPLSETYVAVDFYPHFSFATREGKGAKAATWIVLTDKQPPIKEWLAAAEPVETLRLWCGKEKASFVALNLDENMEVDYYFLCPADGWVTSEGLNTANGLESIVPKFETRDAKRLKGTLKTGQGNCPGPNGTPAYCKATGDFAFDAPFAH